MIKAIVFDFDGTIVDTFPLTIKTVNSLAGKYGFPPIPPRDAQSIRSRSIIRAFRNEIKMSFWKIPFFVREVTRKVRNETREAKVVRAFPGMVQVMEQLSRRFTVGIVTLNTEETVTEALRKHHIKCVSFIYSSSMAFHKHRLLERMLREEGLSKDEVLYVGDELRDIKACRKAGIRIAAVTWGYNSKEALEEAKPDYLVQKPRDLLKIV